MRPVTLSQTSKVRPSRCGVQPFINIASISTHGSRPTRADPPNISGDVSHGSAGDPERPSSIKGEPRRPAPSAVHIPQPSESSDRNGRCGYGSADSTYRAPAGSTARFSAKCPCGQEPTTSVTTGAQQPPSCPENGSGGLSRCSWSRSPFGLLFVVPNPPPVPESAASP